VYIGKLKDGGYNLIIEKSAAKNGYKNFKVDEIIDTEKGAMHENAVFRGEKDSLFVKWGTNDFSYDQFILEAQGLGYIKEKANIYTPRVIDILKVEGDALLIMEAIDIKPVKTKHEWAILGRSLAMLHKATWNRCGYETHNYLGIFKQDNEPTDTWAEFYGERRIRPGIQLALNSGNITVAQCEVLEKLIDRLPELCDDTQPFSLLHGDPWIGNILYDGQRAIMIDCSIYYGNREIDLSTVELFRPVPQYFFDGYNEVYPIDKGYEERRDLWRINQFLGIVTLFGQEHIPQLMDAVKKYL
jgi:fructosamine-3-kinase